jgi:hypothetical protein
LPHLFQLPAQEIGERFDAKPPRHEQQQAIALQIGLAAATMLPMLLGLVLQPFRKLAG